MHQKHLLRFIKSKLRKEPDELVIFRWDGASWDHIMALTCFAAGASFCVEGRQVVDSTNCAQHHQQLYVYMLLC